MANEVTDLDLYEAMASKFYSDTGMMAPGKDEPSACCGIHTYEERQAAWAQWKKEALVNLFWDALPEGLEFKFYKIPQGDTRPDEPFDEEYLQGYGDCDV